MKKQPTDLAISIVEFSHGLAKNIYRALQDLGFTQLCFAQTAQKAVFANFESCELLILAVDKANESLLQALRKALDQHPLPVIIFAEQECDNLIQQIIDSGVSAYVVNEFQPRRIMRTIELAIARFNATHHLKQALAESKQQLAERKIIEQAKGLLMEQHRISEQQAYSGLRKMAMNHGHSIYEVAKQIIELQTIFATNIKSG